MRENQIPKLMLNFSLQTKMEVLRKNELTNERRLMLFDKIMVSQIFIFFSLHGDMNILICLQIFSPSQKIKWKRKTCKIFSSSGALHTDETKEDDGHAIPSRAVVKTSSASASPSHSHVNDDDVFNRKSKYSKFLFFYSKYHCLHVSVSTSITFTFLFGYK